MTREQLLEEDINYLKSISTKVETESMKVFNSLKDGSMLRTNELLGVTNESFPRVIQYLESIRYDSKTNKFHSAGNTKKFYSVSLLIEEEGINESVELFAFGFTASAAVHGSRIPKEPKDFLWILLLDASPFKCNMDQKANVNMTEQLIKYYQDSNMPTPKFEYNCFYKVLITELSRVVWIDMYDLYKIVYSCVDRSIYDALNKKVPVDFSGEIIL
jgi:hypothetical protein